MSDALFQQLVKQRQKVARRQLRNFQPPQFDRPLIIVSAPRAGSTLLFETLARFPDLWTIGEESHELMEGIPELHPVAHGYASNRLTAVDATPTVISTLHDRFARQLRDRNGRNLIDLPATERPTAIRMLEKTPKNALRIPFLRALFPTARFLFLYREPAENISSLLEGWQSQRFIAYRSLPGWPHGAWSFLLTPGWETLVNCSLVEIAAHQWRVANETILCDLALIPRTEWLLVRYADLIANPQAIVQQIGEFANLQWDDLIGQLVAQALPPSAMVLSAPAPQKWRKHVAELRTVLPGTEAVVKQVNAQILLQTIHRT